MKSIVKKAAFVLFILWAFVATIWGIVLTERQRDFEAFASGHIELLMLELSNTNINASRLENDMEKFKEQQANIIEQQGFVAPGFGTRRCGQDKKEDKK